MKTSKKRVTIVHTSFVIFDTLQALFREMVPGVEVKNIVDDSLLPEVMAKGGITENVQERMNTYFKMAEQSGADLVFSQCSSVGEAADTSANEIGIPVIKVDTRMAEEACRVGKRIGVVATVSTTMGLTCRLVEATAKRLEHEIEVVPCLVEGAFEALIGGDRQSHDEKVLGAIRGLLDQVEVVVCAQGSMAKIVGELGDPQVPVLTSLRSGVQSVADYFEELNE
ncbi:MAG: aspartate/glutamate racemase family protein [Verrucomicrobia bacterium]|nr:aspartate/glutamate racemase family protein [Verrucomicrobiota bacterium]